MHDEDLLGLWDSGPYDYGLMETSWMGFLPDGRGWSAWANFVGGIDVGRFRWHCPEPAVVHLRYESHIAGQWQDPEDEFRFATISSRRPGGEVVDATYTIKPDETLMSPEPFTALHLEKDVYFCSTYGLRRRELSIEDDPAHLLAPWH
ncbi:hypothetical protein ACIBI9_46110 [Nonomuraea sp. NPDC050451]|uniref:hypothetical protein n=1 Tax=Nonomuraea sp. NPDC050451 TaxID=3364364 RepID=UPI0037B497A9